jgi:hypothetical protein
LVDSFVDGVDGFDAMAAEIVGGVFEVCFELRRDSMAARICGCFSGGAGAAGTAFAGVVAAGAPATFGVAAAAGMATLKTKAAAERMLKNFFVIVGILQVN